MVSLIMNDDEWMKVKMRSMSTEEEAAKIEAKLSIITNLFTGYYKMQYYYGYYAIRVTLRGHDKYLYIYLYYDGLMGLSTDAISQPINSGTIYNIIEKVFIYDSYKEKL